MIISRPPARGWSTKKRAAGSGCIGAEDKIRFFIGPGPHGTPLETRVEDLQWMIRWLKNGEGDFHEQPVKIYTNHELLVTQTGNVENEPGSRKLYELILDEFRVEETAEDDSRTACGTAPAEGSVARYRTRI